MCLSIPGKVVEINGEDVVVDYGIEKRKAKKVFDVKVGEYVVVSNKIIIMKVPEEEALKSIELMTNSKYNGK